MKREKQLIVVRGGGDIATGTIYRLCRCGYPVLVLETEHPSAIRRHVAFSEAVYDGQAEVEGMTCRLAENFGEACRILEQGEPAMLIDPRCRILEKIRPWALVDGILAKRNLGTSRAMADKTIALGPGFEAGKDVDLVIETMRGHNLGRVIERGCAMPNTGVPGIIQGYGKERVIHSPGEGIVHPLVQIGDMVEAGQVIAQIVPGPSPAEARDGDSGALSGQREFGDPFGPRDFTGLSGRKADVIPVKTQISGIVRGMIREGYPVWEGFKMADVDPRTSEYDNCFTISDKARCIAGGVLEGLLYLEKREEAALAGRKGGI
ncbi:MAG: selenium-dependent molybdenum cofactor biosynthesis protein YqeB [Candidatus Limivivens sp.]|nr:selenium-dependent molybdenum cofactor biosynthesis protein YqeB [Candidatus Limivivens sp.]